MLSHRFRLVRVQNDSEDGKSKCKVSLVSQKQGALAHDTLYAPKPNDFCNKLTNGSRLKLAYTVRPELEEDTVSKSESVQVVSTHLGAISIAFTPIPLYSADIIAQYTSEDGFAGYYGPLPIKNLPPFRRRGPIFYVEATPFDASFETIPSMPKVASPFEAKYTLINRTGLQQRLKVSMVETEGTTNGMLVSGIINGELVLGPMESKDLRYTILVTKIGKTVMPALNVSSLRYNTWIIRSSTQNSIYVLP